MSVFVPGALALLLIAFAFVIPPLWRSARGAAVILLVALPLATAGLYLWVGTPAALNAQRITDEAAPASLDEAVEALAAELRQNPERVDGWLLLGRSRKTQARYAEAREAYARAHQLAPDDPDILVEYAEAMALASDSRRLDGEALGMLQRALDLNPQHQRALWFLGVHHMQAGEPAEAAQVWQERLLPLVDAGTADALRVQIGNARSAADLPPLAEPAAPEALLTVEVELASELVPRLDASDTLFVFARQPDGPGMPVAVKRLPARGFPLKVALSDADSPMPTLKLSQAGRLTLVARVSKSGNAGAQPGDFEAAPLDVQATPGARYALRIDRVVE